MVHMYVEFLPSLMHTLRVKLPILEFTNDIDLRDSITDALVLLIITTLDFSSSISIEFLSTYL